MYEFKLSPETDIGHYIWQDILAIIAKRHDSLNASLQCEYRQTLSCCPPDLTNLLQMADPSRWRIRHVVYGIPSQNKRSYATPSQDILRQIYRIPTYMESYTPTRLDFRSSLIKSHNSLSYSIQYFIPLSPFPVPTAQDTLISKPSFY